MLDFAASVGYEDTTAPLIPIEVTVMGERDGPQKYVLHIDAAQGTGPLDLEEPATQPSEQDEVASHDDFTPQADHQAEPGVAHAAGLPSEIRNPNPSETQTQPIEYEVIRAGASKHAKCKSK